MGRIHHKRSALGFQKERGKFRQERTIRVRFTEEVESELKSKLNFYRLGKLAAGQRGPKNETVLLTGPAGKLGNLTGPGEVRAVPELSTLPCSPHPHGYQPSFFSRHLRKMNFSQCEKVISGRELRVIHGVLLSPPPPQALSGVGELDN